jgi:CBS domain-containing protein
LLDGGFHVDQTRPSNGIGTLLSVGAYRRSAVMDAGEICNREVVVAYRNMSLVEAAKLMREFHVGSLVVVVDRLS